MTRLTEYVLAACVKEQLRLDFGSAEGNAAENNAADIETRFDLKMKELLGPDEEPAENDTARDDFQELLNESLYPYLACYRALVDSGYDEQFAFQYVKDIRGE